jgi:hypothetical protein
MKTKSNSRSAFFNPRVVIGFAVYATGLVLAFGVMSSVAAEDNAAADLSQSVPGGALLARNIVLAQNLGPPGNLYILDQGWIVSGPLSSYVSEEGMGGLFTPTVNCHAKTLEMALGWTEGTRKARFGIYTDNQGNVGSLIMDAATTIIPNHGVCCQLASATLPGAGAALVAGVHYHLVATSDPSAPNFAGLVAFIPPVNGGYNGQTFNAGAGWIKGWTYYAAFRVRGTQP